MSRKHYGLTDLWEQKSVKSDGSVINVTLAPHAVKVCRFEKK
ncbi:MAG: hypothetical protein AB7V25_14190 [Mangrovibacterium sp.]